MWQLFPHQELAINRISALSKQGVRTIVYQLPTGGGKTVTFSGLVMRYQQSIDRPIMILVHREELLGQTRRTLYNGFNIMSQPVKAGMRGIPRAKVYVGMVETVNNWLKKSPNIFGKIGLLIVDECHIGNFKKTYEHFTNSLIIGFSATPISSSKKDPLINHFEDIVVGPQVSELISMSRLSSNETYSIKNVNHSDLKTARGEFKIGEMADKFSKVKHVSNVVDAYERMCKNEKTLIFNCNVEHSKLVNDAFKSRGYNSRHVDGKEKGPQRKEIMQWLKHNDDAILNNIGVLTTGFDEPSIKNIIINRSTKSLPLWLQMTGRGSRVMDGKSHFTIVDMGGNALKHGDWRADRDWADLFYNPDKTSDGGGLPPIKACEGCDALIPAQAVVCKICGHVHERESTYDDIKPEFELLVKRINVSQVVQRVEKQGHKEWSGFFRILEACVTSLTSRIDINDMDDEQVKEGSEVFAIKVKEWCKEVGKPYSRSVRDFSEREWIKAIGKLKTVAV